MDEWREMDKLANWVIFTLKNHQVTEPSAEHVILLLDLVRCRRLEPPISVSLC
jgi:hypothetical protein